VPRWSAESMAGRPTGVTSPTLMSSPEDQFARRRRPLSRRAPAPLRQAVP
jgi:rRNA maturation protein Nop10